MKNFNQILNNICLLTDSYKVSHYLQYPDKTEKVSSYFESREGAKFPEGVFFGLQYYLETYLAGKVVTEEKIQYAKELTALHFGSEVFNEKGWRYILEKHDGHLPIQIKAVPEGTVVPQSNVLMAVENTDKNCYWLTNYLESILLHPWYGCTVATQSREMKKIIQKYLIKTGTPELIDFKLHDFGFRGVSSIETAAVGGAAHLLNFKGTDTLVGCVLAKEIYDCPIAGFSIPAAEHSTITSWTREGEEKAYENMLEKYPKGFVAVVSDSYDIYNACKNIWGKKLREKVLNRDGTLVIRPDSGDPPKVVCEILHILYEAFGGRVNEKGYKVLDDHIRIIQGDGIDFDMLDMILCEMEKQGFSADNIAFGSGGGLLQKLNRDIQKFAFKCCAITVDGKQHDVYKDPVTDPGKISKRGEQMLVKGPNGFYSTRRTPDKVDHLIEVFNNGHVTKRHSFEECRERCKL